mmetsp:Transcript_12420/g.23776  ORF Transcript_12420/g.23776 Transcript_12420/m.23776 type:complete len:115 (-) Transcript_12420:445-789(-)|eukprot:scaffold1564_cov174-Amphora_coffeaeformis.AAC.24
METRGVAVEILDRIEQGGGDGATDDAPLAGGGVGKDQGQLRRSVLPSKNKCEKVDSTNCNVGATSANHCRKMGLDTEDSAGRPNEDTQGSGVGFSPFSPTEARDDSSSIARTKP